MQIISVLIGMIILYILQTILFVKYWDNHLNVSVKFLQHDLSEGDTVVIEECIENRKWIPLPMIKLKYNLSKSFYEKDTVESTTSDCYNRNVIFSILMFQRVRRKVDFICRRRGVYKIENLSLLVESFFLNDSYVEDLNSGSKLIVYPKTVIMPQFMNLFQNVYGDIITKQFMMEDPFLYRGIREYQNFDTMKTINWSASARTGELKVNVLENTSRQEVIICLNLQRDTVLTSGDVLEECIRLAKTFCLFLSKKGLMPFIYSNGKDIENGQLSVLETLNPNQTYMGAVNEILARIVVKEGGTAIKEYEEENYTDLFGEKIKTLSQNRYVIFISNYQREDFQTMLMDLKYQNRDFIWIIPVANRADYHPAAALKKYYHIWRLNWEDVQGES